MGIYVMTEVSCQIREFPVELLGNRKKLTEKRGEGEHGSKNEKISVGILDFYGVTVRYFSGDCPYEHTGNRSRVY